VNIHEFEIKQEDGIDRQVILAYHLHEVFGQILLKDNKFRALLLRLNQNIETAQREMVSAGIVKECADCAVKGDGTCCGRRTGYKYDSILLFINLLLGKSLPIKSQDPHLCYFLTKEGCSLKARHVICVNFICQRLRKNIQHDKLIRLQEITGEELNTLFIIEEYIKKKIKPNLINSNNADIVQKFI
jgi:hypothetical protein